MIKKLYLKFGGGCYTARVSNEGVKTFDYKILLCKFEFYYDADHHVLQPHIDRRGRFKHETYFLLIP